MKFPKFSTTATGSALCGTVASDKNSGRMPRPKASFRRQSMHKYFVRFRSRHEFWLLLVIVALAVILSLFSPRFFPLANLSDSLTSNAYPPILFSGLVVVLIAGGIDVSFTAIASV